MSEPVVICCIVPSKGVFTNAMPLSEYEFTETHADRQVFLFLTCVIASPAQDRSPLNTPHSQTAHTCVHVPFDFKSRQERNELCFPLQTVVSLLILAFTFQVMQRLVRGGTGQACF